MNKSNTDNIAENAANIENIFNGQLGYELGRGKGPGDEIQIKTGNIITDYKILADYDFNRSGIDFYQKAVVLQNIKTGEIYFHFNGTGDGNWQYNAAAYGVKPQPSDMQRGCLLWFDMTMEKLKAEEKITDNSTVYVTGHSQGGNNAMFVTMRSKYANDIDACVPLDGPGFSNKFVSDTKAMLGKDEYDKRRDKIWAYIGENDYVAFLGQQSIVPEDKEHTQFVKYYNENEGKIDFELCHSAKGLVNKNGIMKFVSDHSDFRKLLKSFVDQIPKLPQEDQVLVANTIMAICENYIISEGEFRIADIPPEDFKRTLNILIPVLAEFLKEHPEEIGAVLSKFFDFDSSVEAAIVGVIEQYGKLDRADRETFLEAIFDLFKIEDNKISVDLTKMKEAYDVVSDMIEKMIFSDPTTAFKFFEEHGITFAPIQYAALILAFIIWKGVDLGIEMIIEIVDTVITMYDTLKVVCGKVADVLFKMFESVKAVITSIKTWLRKMTNKGIKYVKENPYFNADTAKLRYYADRLERINRRLSNLDKEMRALYWQVGVLDIWDILCCNLITSPSYSLKKAKNYLNNTANRLEKAENKAKGYMGG